MRVRTLLGFGAFTTVAGVLGSYATRRSVNSAWYNLELEKPPFQPPREVFAPAWTALYAAMTASVARVYEAPPSRARTRALTLWGAQLALNTGWSAIFFGARRPGLALVELGALLVAVGAYTHQARKVDRRAAQLMLPYLGWTAFAMLLNEEIVRRN
jgi:tryptophan-rich sensory protein